MIASYGALATTFVGFLAHVFLSHALITVGLYQPHTSEWCGSGGDSGHQGEWRWWPKANDAPSYSKDDLLNGSADVLAQSLPYVRHEFISVLRYEIEPGVYDGGFASTLESLVQDVVFDLAVEARVHTQSKFSRYLSPRRYVEVISAPLDALFISDLFAAEGAALRAAASAEDDRTFFRLITLWSAYMHKLGSSTLVYHTLRHLDAMALAASAGLRDEVSKHQQSVLCTASRARHDYRDVNNGVTDQEIYDSVRGLICHMRYDLTLAVYRTSSPP